MLRSNLSFSKAAFSTDLQHCFLQPVVDQLGVALLLLQLLLQLSDTSLQPSPLLCNLSTEIKMWEGGEEG